uniref:Uncharacterized protein n=1 Tax=Chrysotila carterae TaxID=13221 RepID=A0A7S4BBC0_CHRCT|mmetsp:Transcript_31883/g.69767  ORF Transcript_31883/g.69767 Transcript_31883/m.69767 type:complete len:296 (+) Transcript_31883:57-944(+)
MASWPAALMSPRSQTLLPWLIMLAAIAVTYAKKSAEATPEAAAAGINAMLANLRDILLFRGEYSYAYYFYLTGYCLTCCRALREKDASARWHYALPLLFLTSFGGGIMVPITLGKPMVLYVNESIVPIMCLSYLAVNTIPAVLQLISSRVGRIITNTLFEIMRFHVLAGCAATAASNLPSPSYYPVPVVGPIVAGIMGGCGGAFMPLSSGLAAIENGCPWRVQSSFLVSLWLQLSCCDPNVSPYLEAVFPAFSDKTWAQMCGVLFFVLVPVFQANGYNVFGANPLAGASVKVKKS